MAKATVFYSWQAQLPSKTNRGLIQDALERAAKKLRADDSLGVEPVIDRDTQGLAGSPDIHTAILNKIRDCDAAVFDVSFVQGGERLHPNPNVLIELGYALGTIGWERIVLVLNAKHGEVEQLPFDIKTKLVLKYSMSQEEEPATARNYLASQIEERLRVILTQHPREVAPDLVAKAIAALHEGKPGAVAHLRSALAPMVGELTAKQPVPAEGEATFAATLRAFSETSSLVAEFAALAAAVVDCTHGEGFEELLGAMERLATAQSSQRTAASRSDVFDVQRLLVWEMIMLAAAVCLKAGNWSLLRTLGARQFAFKFDHQERSGNFAHLLTDVATIRSYEQANNLKPGVAAGKVMEARYHSGGLGGVQFKEMREADFFLYELTELESEQVADFGRWVPMLFQFGAQDDKPITWLRRARSAAWLEKVASAMGLDGPTFKARYAERWNRVVRIFHDTWWSLGSDLNWLLLEPKELASQR